MTVSSIHHAHESPSHPAEATETVRLSTVGAAAVWPAPQETQEHQGQPFWEAQRALAATLQVSIRLDLSEFTASARFMEAFPIAYARQHHVLGLAGQGAVMEVAVADLRHGDLLDIIHRILGVPVTPVLVPAAAILAAINGAYQQRTGMADRLIQALAPVTADHQLTEMSAAASPSGAVCGGDNPAAQATERIISQLTAGTGKEDLLDSSARAPVIQLVNALLFEAVQAQASDVHLHPYEDQLTVRLRIDGVLFDAHILPKAVQEEVVSRVKVMGRMNIAEKRLPQDGRATVQVGDRLIDLRLASLPTSFGERMVIRLLDKSARLYSLSELGMDALTLERFRGLIGVEHGLVLVTGPTGSGKSTTLYGALQEISSAEHNILTLEDPIEYQLPGISQTQVSEKKGMTFAKGLRSVLRQDPDIIMVGEIRDRETAVMAIQSSLTGHLVFSTLHTNDAASAITRLADLGVEPYLVASSVIGVLAQRLVRKVCPHCAHEYTPTLPQCTRLGLPVTTATEEIHPWRRGLGCAVCRQTGYRGRVGIFELLLIDDHVRQQIQRLATAADIKAVALAGGMRTLRDDGVGKVQAGITAPEEVLRVTLHAAY